MEARVIGLEKLGKHDVELVGGKNSSLGEMISHLSNAGVSVPGGFATTAAAYREFLEQSGLNAKIQAELSTLNVDDVNALAYLALKFANGLSILRLQQDLKKKFATLSLNYLTATLTSRLPFAHLRLQKIYQTLLLPASKKLS